MNASTQRAALPPHATEEADRSFAAPEDTSSFDQNFDQLPWLESAAPRDVHHGAGGRAVLGLALAILAALWVGYCAWAAGRDLAGQPLSSPAIAQWVALAAGPLALMGLAWIMFGRTRRKEAERFTHSVMAMRAEARSLEALLGVLAQRISDSQSDLGSMAQRLMQLGDDTTRKFDNVTRDLDTSSERMAAHGQALDRAAESARNDIAVLLGDLPQAEATARTMAEQLRASGSEATRQAAEFERHVVTLGERSREAELMVTEAAQRLVSHLTHIESAGAAAAARVSDAGTTLAGTVDALLNRTSDTLHEIRSGIDAHSQAVSALVGQASAGIGRAGGDAAEALAANISTANQALDGLTSRLAEQERTSQRITAETARALAELDQRFAVFAEQGDARAETIAGAIGRARAELMALGAEAATQDGTVNNLSDRTLALRATMEQLTTEVSGQLARALAESEDGAARLLQSAQAVRPEIEWMRVAAAESSEHIAASAAGISEQQDSFAALLATIDEGVAGAHSNLESLTGAIATAQSEANELSRETGPALVAAMVQVREAAAHAAERARAAIDEVIPEGAEKLSAATRKALEAAIREGIEDRLREVETAAGRAVESARAASDRLTQQMLTLGQSATALEQHIERTNAAQRERDSEAFARRVSLLIDSMHSAAIDVGKILSNEVDEKAWDSYLKGNRGVFTRRAARLLDGSEANAIRAHYESDGEFQQSVNRYVHDFEAMLRRVLAERDGGMIAVTLMSSDMGKLYAALAEAIERRR